MKSISLLHPFTPQAAGVVEQSVATYHSQPHLKAMEEFSAKTGYECSIEYFTPKRRTYTFLKDAIRYVFYPVDFTWNGDHKKWKKQTSKKCLTAYKQNTPDVTIINMSGHSSPFSHELSRLILAKGKTYIAMLGGQHYTDTPENRSYYKNAHHLLVHTHLQKSTMEDLPMFKDIDIRVFPLGVDCEIFYPKIKKNAQPKLLYVGRIVEWKRIHIAIEGIKALHDSGFMGAQLNIIGPVSSENYLKVLKQLISNLKLDNFVHFLGHKEHHELPSYFQEADLFTLPSDKETFGMVMIEAMACGTPVAGMDCPGGPADVITDLNNGILATPETYASRLVDYFKDEKLQERLQRASRIKVVEEYSLQATYQVLKNSVYSALNLTDA